MMNTIPPTMEPWTALTVGSLVKLSGRIEGRAKTVMTQKASREFTKASETAFMMCVSGDSLPSGDLLHLVKIGDRLSTAVDYRDDVEASKIIEELLPVGEPVLAMGR